LLLKKVVHCCACCNESALARRACFDAGSLRLWRWLREARLTFLCIIIIVAIAAFVAMLTTEAGLVGIVLLSQFVCFLVMGLFMIFSCRGNFATDDLETSVLRGNVVAADWMIRKGAVLDPTLLLSENGSRGEMARMLIGHIVAADTDADVKVRQLVGPLINASARDDLAVAQLLLESGADPNLGGPTSPGMRPVFFAKSLKMVKLLVEAGADVATRGGLDGRTSVVSLATYRGRPEIVEYLANVVLNNHLPFEPHLLHSVRTEFVAIFVRLGSDVDAVGIDSLGATALHIAALHHDLAKVRFLLACNASVDAQMPMNHGLSPAAMPMPIELAISREVITFLLAAGSKRGTCTFFEPTEEAIADATRQIARQRFDMIRARAFEICVALDSLELPALLMCVIIDAVCAPFAVCVPFHSKWELVVAVKHRKEWSWSSARSDSAESDSDSWVIDVDD
jgi:hypothetical protein